MNTRRVIATGVVSVIASGWVLLAMLPQIIGEGDRDITTCHEPWSSTDVLQKALTLAGIAVLYLLYTAHRDRSARTPWWTVAALALMVMWGSLAIC